MTWEIWWQNIKENAEENMVIFSLLLYLKIIEENKKGKGKVALYNLYLIFGFNSDICSFLYIYIWNKRDIYQSVEKEKYKIESLFFFPLNN